MKKAFGILLVLFCLVSSVQSWASENSEIVEELLTEIEMLNKEFQELKSLNQTLKVQLTKAEEEMKKVNEQLKKSDMSLEKSQEAQKMQEKQISLLQNQLEQQETLFENQSKLLIEQGTQLNLLKSGWQESMNSQKSSEIMNLIENFLYALGGYGIRSLQESFQNN